MLRRILSITLLTIGAFCLAGGITAFTVRQGLLTPSLYTNALQEAKFYKATTAIIEYKAADFLINAQQSLLNSLLAQFQNDITSSPIFQQVILYLINHAINQETQKIVQTVSANIQLDKTLQNTSDSAVKYFIEWLKGEQPDPVFLKYIPTPEQISTVRQEGIASLLLQNSQLSIAAGSGLLNTQLENSINGFLSQYQLADVVNSAIDFATIISQNVQNLYTLRAFIQDSVTWTYWGIIGGSVFMAAGIAVTNFNRIKATLITLTATGIYLAGSAYGTTVFLISSVQQVLPQPTATTGMTDIPLDLRLNFIQSINVAAQYIITAVFAKAFYIGLLIAGASFILLLITFIVPPLVPFARRIIFRKGKKTTTTMEEGTEVQEIEQVVAPETPKPTKRFRRHRRKEK